MNKTHDLGRALDVEAVQAFILISDLQSFTRAAEALGTSQATVSIRLKRLEERLGDRLIERTPRSVRLSSRGAAFLNAARDFIAAHERALADFAKPQQCFTLGIADQIAGPELPVLLARLNKHDPSLLMEVRIASSPELLSGFDRGSLDAVIVRREDDGRKGEVLALEAFGWFAAPTYQLMRGDTLRLASLAEACGVRSASTEALDSAGVRWTEVFVGGGMAAIIAAVDAGLAVAPLAKRVAPTTLVEVGAGLDLPVLPTSEIVLHSRLSDERSQSALRVVAAAFRTHRASAS